MPQLLRHSPGAFLESKQDQPECRQAGLGDLLHAPTTLRMVRASTGQISSTMGCVEREQLTTVGTEGLPHIALRAAASACSGLNQSIALHRRGLMEVVRREAKLLFFMPLDHVDLPFAPVEANANPLSWFWTHLIILLESNT